jgi:hypothetical protein
MNLLIGRMGYWLANSGYKSITQTHIRFLAIYSDQSSKPYKSTIDSFELVDHCPAFQVA